MTIEPGDRPDAPDCREEFARRKRSKGRVGNIILVLYGAVVVAVIVLFAMGADPATVRWANAFIALGLGIHVFVLRANACPHCRKELLQPADHVETPPVFCPCGARLL